MSKNIRDLTYTEILERASELARDSSENTRTKIRGIIQDVYMREIPLKEDWQFYLTDSAITTLVEYKSGTVSIEPGSSNAVFSSVVSADSSFALRKAKFDGNDLVYDLAFVAANSLTVTPPLSGTTKISAGTYTIFRNIYSLAADFERFPKNAGLIKMEGGQKTYLSEVSNDNYQDEFSATPSDTLEGYRFIGIDTAGNQQIELIPPPKTAKSYPYQYYRLPAPLNENSAGFVVITAGSTTVTGSAGTTQFTEMNSGDWLRVFGKGGDSEWYKIRSITNDSSLTLEVAFGTSSANTSNFIISSRLDLPLKMQPAVLYGTIRTILLDQSDDKAAFYNIKMAEVLSDGKRIYKSRVYGKQIDTMAEEFMFRR